LRSVVSSPSGVRGGATAAIAFYRHISGPQKPKNRTKPQLIVVTDRQHRPCVVLESDYSLYIKDFHELIFCTSQKCGPLEIAGPGDAAPIAPPP